MELTVRIDGGGRSSRTSLYARLMDWILGPPEGRPASRKSETDAEARARQRIEELDRPGLAVQISKVLWAQRGSLSVKVGDATRSNVRGLHSPEKRSFGVEIPGGIRMEFDEECGSFSVTSPDGEQERFTGHEAGRLATTWRAIQAMSMCDAMGVVVPTAGDGIRPTAVLKALDDAVCAIVERGDPPRSTETYESEYYHRGHEEGARWSEQRSGWRDLGCGVFLDPSQQGGGYYERDVAAPTWYRVMTAEMGVIRLRREPLAAALERRKRSSFASALGLARDLPVHLPMPSGNAQAARVLRLCREAVAREPDLVDAKGTRIAPLVERHLPRLMQRHADAARSADTSELAGIDAELMQGIELVRLAVEEALVVSRVDKREALRTELAFLEYRHPAPNLLSLDLPKDPA